MPTSRAWQRVSPCKMALSSEYMGRESYAMRFCSSSSVPLHNTSYLGIVAWTALLPAAPGWQSGSPQLVLKDTQSSYCKDRYAKYRHHSNQYNRAARWHTIESEMPACHHCPQQAEQNGAHCQNPKHR